MMMMMMHSARTRARKHIYTRTRPYILLLMNTLTADEDAHSIIYIVR